jgi:hypothetical protein
MLVEHGAGMTMFFDHRSDRKPFLHLYPEVRNLISSYFPVEDFINLVAPRLSGSSNLQFAPFKVPANGTDLSRLR